MQVKNKQKTLIILPAYHVRMENNSKLKFGLMFLFGMVIGLLVIIAITKSANNPDLMYFIATSFVTLIILAFTWNIDKKSSKEICEKLTRIEAKIDALSKNTEYVPVSIEVTKQENHTNLESRIEKKCWFKAKGYQ